MEPKIRQGFLYDFYGELLNEHQRDIYEAYVLEDLSLKEEKLHLIEKFGHVRAKVDEIVSLTEEKSSDENLLKIKQVSDEILEVL